MKISKSINLSISIGLLLGSTAFASSDPRGPNSIEMFNISANSVDCFGIGPQKCLLVNGQLFYDNIDGYNHSEGIASTICVQVASQSVAGIADSSSRTYRRISDSDCGLTPQPRPQPGPSAGQYMIFKVGANEATCFGVGPRNCLVVNDQLFYGNIEGYSHINGRAADLCVEVISRTFSHPADAGSQIFQRADDSICGINTQPTEQGITISDLIQNARRAADHCHTHEPNYRHHCHSHK